MFESFMVLMNIHGYHDSVSKSLQSVVILAA